MCIAGTIGRKSRIVSSHMHITYIHIFDTRSSRTKRQDPKHKLRRFDGDMTHEVSAVKDKLAVDLCLSHVRTHTSSATPQHDIMHIFPYLWHIKL